MTRALIPATIMDEEVELRITPRLQTLKTEKDDVLEAKIRGGLRYADNQDINRTRLGLWNVIGAPNEFYEGIAAMRLLVERHGKDYVLNLMGLREPETFTEKARYFFTGALPTVKK